MIDQSSSEAAAYRAELRAFRAQLSAYYEKLALLDGAIVALTITAVLGGPLHDKIRHKYFLGVGLTVLVISLLVLLYRNLLAVEYERASTGVWFSTVGGLRGPEMLESLLTRRQWLEVIGTVLTGIGILLLLINVWLLLSG